MKLIPLTQDKFAKVDDEHFEILNQHKWCAIKRDNGNFYAVRQSSRKEKQKRHHIKMHRQIMGLTYGDKREVDHINHDGLNNQKHNLRICTTAENQHNQKPRSNCSSTYKGVYWHKKIKRWQARIVFNSELIHVGSFEHEIEAARAYDEAAVKYFGEFARLNDVA